MNIYAGEGVKIGCAIIGPTDPGACQKQSPIPEGSGMICCPKCQCNEINASGICMWCGHQVNGAVREALPEPAPEIEQEQPETEAQVDLPQWRRELANRLQVIRKKREAEQAKSMSRTETSQTVAAGEQKQSAEKSESPAKRAPLKARRRRANSTQTTAESAPPALAAVEKKLFDDAPPAQDFSIENDESGGGKMPHIELPRPSLPAETQTFGSPYALSSLAVPASEHKKMILVYRFLSGLLDLMIMVISAGALIIAADLLSGIRAPVRLGIMHCAMLFLLVYLVYSLVFLGISNQTIGMMMMNLRVIGEDGQRARPGQMFARIGAYLLSLLCVGTGLIWALFDKDCLCFHDRATGTRLSRTESEILQ